MPRGSAPGERRGGRVAGVPNKVTSDVKGMILNALSAAGGERYLLQQARRNPTAFLQLVAKVLPHTITGVNDGPVHFSFEWASAASAGPQLEPEVAGLIAAVDDEGC
jgi:hypothetical protein